MSRRGSENTSSSSLKSDKSVTRMLQRGGYAKMRNHERLSGGADAKSKSNSTASKSGADTNPKAVTPVVSDASRAATEAEEDSGTILEESNDNPGEEETGDKKVNEMIEYVIENLREAGKALASLGENFEQDLKLLFDDIVRKVKNWVSEGEIRLDEANENLDKLRREITSKLNEIASRNLEIADLRKQLDETKASHVSSVEKHSKETTVETIEPSTRTSAPLHEPSSAAPLSTHLEDSGEQSDDESETRSSEQFRARISAPSGAQKRPTSGRETRATSGTVASPISGSETRATSGTAVSPTSGAEPDAPRGELSAPPESEFGTETESQVQTRATSGAKMPATASVEAVDESEAGSRVADLGTPRQRGSTADGEISIDPVATASSVRAQKSYAVPSSQDERETERISHQRSREISQTSGQSKMFVDPGEAASSDTAKRSSRVSTRVDRPQEKHVHSQSKRLSGSPDASHVPAVTTDAAVQSGKSKERVKRASELESEVSRLKKENERIIKEKVDYENAIQRALLRGVSSLNAETLKVLKCPPVPCFTPCRSSVSPVDTGEPVTSGSQKNVRDNWTPRGVRSSANGTSPSTQGVVRNKSNKQSHPERTSVCGNAKTLSIGAHGASAKQKKSPSTSDGSMVFVLHQADASSICVSSNSTKVRPCGRTKSKKLENSISVRKLG